MRLLDLFCGAGGTAEGYRRAGFDEIVGVDINPQPNYPFKFIQNDALSYPTDAFDMIHASPPCQAYIQRNKNLETKHPKLIEPTREHLQRTGIPYVIENVLPEVLQEPTMLCGTMFNLLVIRHRYFETGVGDRLLTIKNEMSCNHWGSVASGDFAGVYAFGGKGHRHGRDETGNRLRDPANTAGPDWNVAMGIDWMTKKEITQAIPPAYTEFIGKEVIKCLSTEY